MENPRPKPAPSTSSGQALSEVEWAKLERGTFGNGSLRISAYSLRRAVAVAVHHAKVCLKRADGLAVLVGHDP
jgi:hypothetical protein